MSFAACKDTNEASKENSKTKASLENKNKFQAQTANKKEKNIDERRFTFTLAIDLNGDAILTHKTDEVYFDIDSDGFAKNTAWISKEDAV